MYYTKKDINYVTTWEFCIYPTIKNWYTLLIKTPAFLCYLKFTPEEADLNFILKLILRCCNFITIYGGARNRVGTELSNKPARDGIFKLPRSPGIDSKESLPPAFVSWARICKPFKESRNRFPASLPCLTGPPGWQNRFIWIDSWALWTFTHGRWRAGTTTLFLLGSYSHP